MIDVFDFRSGTKVLIYGAVSRGRLLNKLLSSAGFNVIGFIDKRAHELSEVDNKPVVSITDAAKIDDIIVVISVKNVFEHRSIVRQLINENIHNIIYCPVEAKDQHVRLNNAYEHICKIQYDGKFSGCDDFLNIPRTEKLLLAELYDSAVMFDGNDYLVANISATHIYRIMEANSRGEPVKTCNTLMLSSIHGFEYFNGNLTADINSYIKYNAKSMTDLGNVPTSEWVKNNLSTRYNVFCELNKRLNLEPNFFIESAQDAVWNDNNKVFDVRGGRHRFSFLLCKGFEYLPLKISKTDYELFLNLPKVEEIYSYMRKYDIYELEAAIPHPYFYSYNYKRLDYFNCIIKPITLKTFQRIKIIYKTEIFEDTSINIEDFSFFVNIYDNGVLARHLYSLGFKIALPEKQKSFERLLNELFYIDNDIVTQEDSAQFDFSFISIIGDADNKISRYLEKTRDTLFLELNSEQKDAHELLKRHKVRMSGYEILRAYNIAGEPYVLVAMYK